MQRPNNVSERAGKQNDRRKRRWKLNLSLAALTLASVAIFAPCLYAWHAYQVKRSAIVLLGRATELEEKGDWREAAQNLHRYLQLRPTENQARVRLAKDYDESAETRNEKQRAIQLYSAAIGVAPQDDELVRRHMELLLDSGDYSAALERCEKLLERDPEDATGLRIKALGSFDRWRVDGRESPDRLVALLEQAIEKDPAHVVLAGRLAWLYRQELKQPEKAEETLARLVDSSTDKAAAYLACYEHRKLFELSDAGSDLDRAVAADPEQDNLHVCLFSGQSALQKGEFDAAIKHFQRTVHLDAKDPRGHHGLGLSHAGKGDDAKAVEVWQQALAMRPSDPTPFMFAIAAAQIRLGSFDDATTTLDRLAEHVGPMGDLNRFDRLSLLSSLRAEVAIRRKDYRQAITFLRRALLEGDGGALTREKANSKLDRLFKLGQCHLATEQWDQAGAAFERAVELRPSSLQAKLAAGRAWELSGRLDAAVRQYGEAIDQHERQPTAEQLPEAAYESYADALYRQQLSIAPANRNIKGVGQAISKARAARADSLLVRVLAAEYPALESAGQADLTVSLLREVEDTAISDFGVSRRLMFDFEYFRHPEDADRIVERWRKSDPSGVQAATLSAELLSRRKLHADAAQQLTLAVAAATPANRAPIQLRLAGLYLAQGKVDLARQELVAVLKAGSPVTTVRALELLTELALNSGDLAQAQERETKLRETEGEDGTSWRFYRAQRLMNLAKDGSKEARGLLTEASDLQAEIERLRPNWVSAYVLKARLLQRGSEPDTHAAIEAYKRCLKLGARHVQVYQELVYLLRRENRITEAATYLDEMRVDGRLPQELTVLGMAIDAQQGNFERATEVAQQEVEKEPENPIHRIRLGELLAAEDDPLAEAEFLRAKTLAPKDLRTWSAVFTYYVKIRNKAKEQADSKGQERAEALAVGLLDEFEENEDIALAERTFFLAQGYWLLGGHAEKVDRLYRQAVEANPDRPAVQLQAALHFLNTDKVLAEKSLLTVLELLPENNDARRMLVALRAQQVESEEDLQKVFALLKQDSPDGGDKRLEAVFMLRRGGSEYRSRAQQILESLVASPTQRATSDRLLLARLYEAQGKHDAAREQLLALVQQRKPSAEHLAILVDHLLRTGRFDEAASRLAELSQLESEASSLRTLQLRVRLLKQQEQVEQVDHVLAQYLGANLPKAANQTDRAQVLLTIAKILSQNGLTKSAENYFRKTLEANSQSYFEFCTWLAEQGRADEALDLCAKAAVADDSATPAITTCQVLTLGKASAEQRQAAEPILQLGLKQHPRSFPLLFSLGTMRLMQGQTDQAVEMFREAYKLNPRNAVIVNNLALALATRPEGQKEALQLIDKAVGIFGQGPELLDSKGWILLQQQRAGEAETLFREALALPPGEATHHFHLAAACQTQGKLDQARESLQRARELALAVDLLTPQERSVLAVLERSLR